MKSFSVRLPLVGLLALVWEPSGAHHYPGGICFHTNLKAELFHHGKWQGVRDLGSGLVTSQGVLAMANDFANVSPSTNDITLLNLHDSSTGTTAAAVGDTALATAPAATVGARVAGVQSAAAAGANATYTSVGTQSYTGTLAITEWGLFRLARAAAAAPPGSDTMWDRKVFSAINVGSGDSIQFTYALTITAGG